MPSRSVPVIFSCAIANKIDTFLRYNARKLRMILDAVVNFDIQYQNQLDTIDIGLFYGILRLTWKYLDLLLECTVGVLIKYSLIKYLLGTWSTIADVRVNLFSINIFKIIFTSFTITSNPHISDWVMCYKTLASFATLKYYRIYEILLLSKVFRNLGQFSGPGHGPGPGSRSGPGSNLDQAFHKQSAPILGIIRRTKLGEVPVLYI